MKKKLLFSGLLIILLVVSSTVMISADTIDFRQCEGETINLLMNKHTYTNSISSYLPLDLFV